MISAHGLCAGWGVGFGLAIGNTAARVMHGATLLRMSSMQVALLDFQVPLSYAICDGFSTMMGDCL